jgi:hypothetical protein
VDDSALVRDFVGGLIAGIIVIEDETAMLQPLRRMLSNRHDVPPRGCRAEIGLDGRRIRIYNSYVNVRVRLWPFSAK